MPRLRVALVSIAIVAVAAACGSSAAAPTYQVSAAPASPQASLSPTAAVSASPAGISASPALAPSVSLTEWSVAVTGTIKSGKTALTINNAGVAAHELLVFKSDRAPAAYPVDAAGNIKEEGAGVLLVSDGENIDAGGTQARTIDLAPGKYLFVCNIPGHFKQGMFVVVNVTA